jgi:hypothetical protein
MGLIKFFRNLASRTRKKQLYEVEVKIWGEHVNRYIARMHFTTDARSKADAKNNVAANLRIHVTDCRVIKEQVNGTKP